MHSNALLFVSNVAFV